MRWISYWRTSSLRQSERRELRVGTRHQAVGGNERKSNAHSRSHSGGLRPSMPLYGCDTSHFGIRSRISRQSSSPAADARWCRRPQAAATAASPPRTRAARESGSHAEQHLQHRRARAGLAEGDDRSFDALLGDREALAIAEHARAVRTSRSWITGAARSRALVVEALRRVARPARRGGRAGCRRRGREARSPRGAAADESRRRRASSGGHAHQRLPPLMSSVAPEIHSAASLARNTAAAPTSSGWPIRPERHLVDHGLFTSRGSPR